MDNGGANVTWSTAGCSHLFSYTSLIYVRGNNQTWAEVGSSSLKTNYKVYSIAFVPGAVYEFKVRLRYKIDNEEILSEESQIYPINITGNPCLKYP